VGTPGGIVDFAGDGVSYNQLRGPLDPKTEAVWSWTEAGSFWVPRKENALASLGGNVVQGY